MPAQPRVATPGGLTYIAPVGMKPAHLAGQKAEIR